MSSKKIVKKETPIQPKKENQPIMKANIKQANIAEHNVNVKEEDSDDNQSQVQVQSHSQNQNNEFDAYEFYKTYDPAKNKFNNVLSLYEFTSCLGLRATQISEGCPVLIDVPEGMESPEEIALLEIKAGKCPLIICREGREYWRVCDLINPHIE